MKSIKNKYSLMNKLAAVFMILSLLWLTVSTPFVYKAQQQLKSYTQSLLAEEEVPGAENDSPFGNTTEEKAESGSNSLSEYLHHIHELTHPAGSLHKHNCSHDVDVYVAFHGELLCPPPNFILS